MGSLVGGLAVLAVAAMAQDGRDVIDARVRAARERLLSERQERTVTAFEANVDRVPCYAMFELAFDVNTRWHNPYDPDDVCVDARINAPGGTTVTVPAFYCQEWRPLDGKTRVALWPKFEVVGQPGWRLRYAPVEVGDYRVVIHVRDRQGTFESAPVSFTATPSSHPGYVAVCPTNPRFFMTSADGKPWWGCGSNLAWVRGDVQGRPDSYEPYLAKVDGKMNASRFFLCHWAWLEWMPIVAGDGNAWSDYGGLQHYNQMIAGELDRILALAEIQHLRFMIVTENNCAFTDDPHDAQGSWSANPYNQLNGGPCKQPGDMLTEPAAGAIYRKRLRYIIARWGYSPSLWALNSWNNYLLPQPGVSEWLTTMRDTVHGLCENWRPIIYGSNYQGEAQSISDYAQAAHRVPGDRPAVMQECYNLQEAIPAFQPALRDEIWGGLADGLAAIMVWPHVVVDKTASWDVFAPVIRFAEGLPLTRPGWEPAPIVVAAAEAPTAAPLEQITEIKVFGDVPFWGARATRNRFAVDLNQQGHFLEGLGRTLYSGTNPDRAVWRNPPTFDVDMPQPGRIIAEIYRYGAARQLFTFKVDGTPVRQFPLAGRMAQDLPRDEVWFEAPVPAGRHAVTVSNEGQDWINVNRYFFAFPVVAATGMVSASGQANPDLGVGFAYVANRMAGQIYQELFQVAACELTNIVVDIQVREPGGYRVDLIDPVSGDVSRTIAAIVGERTLTVTLPSLSSALVLRWSRASIDP